MQSQTLQAKLSAHSYIRLPVKAWPCLRIWHNSYKQTFVSRVQQWELGEASPIKTPRKGQKASSLESSKRSLRRLIERPTASSVITIVWHCIDNCRGIVIVIVRGPDSRLAGRWTKNHHHSLSLTACGTCWPLQVRDTEFTCRQSNDSHI
jgi:hypothetical protein